MPQPSSQPERPSNEALSEFVDGVERQTRDSWAPAIIEFGGEVSHRGETITEEELGRRWEESSRTGIKAIDFRPPNHE